MRFAQGTPVIDWRAAFHVLVEHLVETHPIVRRGKMKFDAARARVHRLRARFDALKEFFVMAAPTVAYDAVAYAGGTVGIVRPSWTTSSRSTVSPKLFPPPNRDRDRHADYHTIHQSIVDACETIPRRIAFIPPDVISTLDAEDAMISLDDQPFITATVARLHMNQGNLDLAEAMFGALLKTRPNDPELINGLSELRMRRDLEQGQTESRGGTLHVEFHPQNNKVICRWTVTPSGTARAMLVLGKEGALTLRLAGYPYSLEPTQREFLDTPLETSTGVMALDPPAHALMIAASIGLISDDGHYASIAHCEMVPLRS